ncbi:MAG: zinc-ribbon domain-containing protein [Deltaproteobacteria bacterium]|nr:zinc-ribbon domain-containing protein [Deltaproteobacteria bacterium]
MIDIACDACGKRYRIDETKMRTETAKVKCKTCGHVVTVARPQPAGVPLPAVEFDFPPEPAAAAAPESPPRPSTADVRLAAERLSEASVTDVRPDDTAALRAFGEPRKVRFGLFGKIIVMMLLVSILPFSILWFLTFREANERTRSDSEALMVQTAKGLGDQVDGWIRGNFSTLRMAASLPEVVSMNREQQDPVLKAIGREYPYMYLIFTVGPNGMNIARSDNQPLVSYADRQYYRDIMAGKAVSWQTVTGRTSKIPALVVAVPIRDGNQVVGVLAAAMTVEDISKKTATWKMGATGFAFLLDEQGNVVSHPQQQYAETRENLNNTPLISAFRKKGWTSITTPFAGDNGQTAIGHARSNSYGWVLAMQQNENEIFETLDIIQNFALTLLAVTVLLVVAIAWFSARALVTPIMKLTDAAERMSLGELNVKIDVKSRDEIGLLAQAIGRMQTSLRMAMSRLKKKR